MSDEIRIINNEPSNAMAVLSLFATSKEGIQNFSNQIISAVREGEIDALRVKAYLKTLEAIAERIDSATKNEQVNEAGKYGEGKTFELAGCEMILTPTKTTYEYKHCGYPDWEEADAEMASAQARREIAEKFLKALPSKIDMVDGRTGEMITVLPASKKQTMGIKITIK